jgi:hypothetical protein
VVGLVLCWSNTSIYWRYLTLTSSLLVSQFISCPNFHSLTRTDIPRNAGSLPLSLSLPFRLQNLYTPTSSHSPQHHHSPPCPQHTSSLCLQDLPHPQNHALCTICLTVSTTCTCTLPSRQQGVNLLSSRWIHIAALTQWDVSVVACPRGSGAVCYGCTWEFAFDGLVDAGFVR